MPTNTLPRVWVREIRPDDGERLRASHARLSPDAQYRRFLSPKPALSAADARYLVEVDGRRHFALVAVASEDPDAIVAVARFVGLSEDPATAEFALVVGDAYQGQGLGTELLDRLISAARERGVTRFVASILSTNHAALALVRRAADGRLRKSRRGLVTEVEFDLETGDSSPEPVAPAMIAACPGS
jgi:RimJ/RimL family protein N-acetyltransferase